jgi:hypothetical protein
MKYIKRVAPSNHRVTCGQIYELDDNDCITDDKGKSMTPVVGNGDYWKIVDNPPTHVNARSVTVEIEKAEQRMCNLKITHSTYINGRDVKDFYSDDIIAMIQAEQMKKQILEGLPKSILEDSRAVKSLLAKHEDNIRKLAKILDENFTEFDYVFTSD